MGFSLKYSSHVHALVTNLADFTRDSRVILIKDHAWSHEISPKFTQESRVESVESVDMRVILVEKRGHAWFSRGSVISISGSTRGSIFSLLISTLNYTMIPYISHYRSLRFISYCCISWTASRRNTCGVDHIIECKLCFQLNYGIWKLKVIQNQIYRIVLFIRKTHIFYLHQNPFLQNIFMDYKNEYLFSHLKNCELKWAKIFRGKNVK